MSLAQGDPHEMLAPHGLRSIEFDADVLTLTRANGAALSFHAFDLYENAPARFDPSSGQRLAGSLDGPAAPSISAVEIGAERLVLRFSDGEALCAPFAWLLGRARSAQRQRLWRRDSASSFPSYDYQRFLDSPQTKRAALTQVARNGFVVLRGAPCQTEEVLHAIGAFAYVRETNYGRIFNVRATQNAANLAYSRLGLDLHTDNPYRDPAPTLQVLHCLRPASDGGETVLADGFAAAEALHAENPKAFALLSQNSVRFAWSDAQTVLEARRRIIECDAHGDVHAVRFNHRSLCPLDLAFPIQPAWRAAYRAFAEIIARPEMHWRFQLAPGDMLIFDNDRVLHGRTEFTDPDRWLQGAYADRDGLNSTLAVLHRTAASNVVAEIDAFFASPEAQEPYGEDISLAQHMLQTAHWARSSGAPDALVAAALLHDAGWPTPGERHEETGARRAAEWFGEEVGAPIRGHVAAKRWLVSAEPDYAALLSPASVRSLALQGGPMDAAERLAFEHSASFGDAVRLRRFDDQAKNPALTPPALDTYKPLLLDLAARHLHQQTEPA